MPGMQIKTAKTAKTANKPLATHLVAADVRRLHLKFMKQS
jgi:hypothetical protein